MAELRIPSHGRAPRNHTLSTNYQLFATLYIFVNPTHIIVRSAVANSFRCYQDGDGMSSLALTLKGFGDEQFSDMLVLLSIGVSSLPNDIVSSEVEISSVSIV